VRIVVHAYVALRCWSHPCPQYGVFVRTLPADVVGHSWRRQRTARLRRRRHRGQANLRQCCFSWSNATSWGRG
jgi:hypothetical protein